MWNLGNRDIVVLVSVISGCAILCNVWGPFYAITITLLVIISAWFCSIVLTTDDTPFTLHALLALDYLEKTIREINGFLENVYLYINGYLTDSVNSVKRLYRVHVLERMAQRRRSTYQLSAETYSTSGNSRFSLVAGLSPIPRGNFRQNSSNVENSPYVDANSRVLEESSSVSKVTSTPLVSCRKEEVRNGDIFGTEHHGGNRLPWAKLGTSIPNHTLSRGEDVTYSTESSPWGACVSPKMRARAGGVKTVQTVAGPLLASTRYNIDPKVYSDVTSPGLTSRLTKYATEANMKLTHQSQYGTGQFPRPNLNSSPTPLINTKTGKIRTPVTVRVAPPENTRYSPPERKQILSDICHSEATTAPTVVQVLKEISLKRHASREDVTFDLAKKQRTEGVFSDGLENLEEMTQKRARDDSSRSEEEISPQNKSLRPAKRTKIPSCHDILSSLSSSINVSSGVKRKAIDISRSGTPDVGKHFKSLDSSHGDGAVSATLSRTIVERTKPNKRSLSDLEASRSSEIICSPNKKMLESVPPKSILKSPPSKQIAINVNEAQKKLNHAVEAFALEMKLFGEFTASKPPQAVNLTDRLFMKAEPQNIDKLKNLIEEHGSIKPRFITNESDEIKKSDIVNMRKTSMKTRLKSMFDAISGKAPSAINPEVVIQAEEAKSTSLPTITASLSSSTSTTNVNTSPIATSAIVPIIGKTKPSTTPAKHVTFQFSTAESTVKTESSAATIKTPIIEAKPANNVVEPKEFDKTEIPIVASKPASTNSIIETFNTPSITTCAPVAASTFSFGSSSLKTTNSSPVKTNLLPTPVTASPNSTNVVTSTSVDLKNSTPLFNAKENFEASPVPVFGNSGQTVGKTATSTIPSSNVTTQIQEKNVQPPAVNFSFGTPATSATTPSSSQTGLFASPPSQNFTTPTSTPAATSASPNLFGISSKTPASFSKSATPATTSMFSFGSNVQPQTAEKKGFTFGVTAATTAQSENNVGITTTSVQSTSNVATPASSASFNFSAGNAASMKTNVFGNAATTSPPVSAFSTPVNTTAAFSFGGNTAATSKPAFAFGSGTTTAPATISASAPSVITFGTSSNTSSPLFRASATATTTAGQPNLFGTPAASANTFSSSTTAAPAFGTTPATSAGFSSNTTAASTFGTPATTTGFSSITTASSFGSASSQSTFVGASNTASNFGTPKTMETPVFGTNSAAAPPSFAASSSSLFGGGTNSNSSGNVATTSAPPAFGTSGFGETKPPPVFGASTAAPSFPVNSASSMFSSQPTVTPTFGTPNSVTTGATSPFGAGNTSASNFGTPSTAPPSFRATNTPTTSFGTPSTAAPTFGGTNAATTSFGTPSTAAPPFGGANTATTSFGTPNTSAPAFGGTNTATTSFGTPNTSAPAFGSSTSTSAFGLQSSAAGTSGIQNSTSSAFGGTGPTFGAVTSAPPSFCTTVASAPGFGNTAASSFGTPSNPPPAFSTASASFSGFSGGSNSASPFGAQTAPGTSTFGNTNSATTTFGSNTGNSSSFTFGAAQPTTQQTQQSAVFAFGGNNTAPTNNSPGGAALPFQFGSPAPQTGGFNFSGAPSTPALNFTRDGAAGGAFTPPTLGAPAFNAPTSGGMFSIGSGSTGPRSRPSRRRQR